MPPVNIAGMLNNSMELDQLRKDQENLLSEINNLHKLLRAAPEVAEEAGGNVLSSLKFMYTRAKELSEKEARVSAELLNQLDALTAPAAPARQRKRIGVNGLKKKRTKSDLMKVSPAMRSQLEACANLKDEQVAAKVSPVDAEKDEWFIVKVMNFDWETKEFEVLDEEPGEEDDGQGQRSYKLPMSAIIPFPKKNNASGSPNFLPEESVLAVFPGTTALYRATVVHHHRKKKTDDYLLVFDDDDGAQRAVPFNRVVALPEGHRQ